MKEIIGVVPVYDPPSGLAERLADILRNTSLRQLIAVDDGCTEPVELQDPRIIVLHHLRNCGKGAALKTAFACIETHFPEAAGALTFDADGQHDTADIAALCSAAEATPETFILGARQFETCRTQPWRSRFGNALTRKIFYFFSGVRLRDTQTGLRFYPCRLMHAMQNISGNRYEFELAALLCACRHGTVRQIPVPARYEAGNPASHFHPVRDSMRIYRVFLAFSLSSVICSILDYLVYAGCLFAGFPVWSALGTARVLSLAVNFCCNRKWVFGAPDHWRRRLGGYLLLAAGLLTASYTGIRLLARAGISPYWSKIPVECLLFYLSFKIQQTKVFHKDRSAEIQKKI